MAQRITPNRNRITVGYRRSITVRPPAAGKHASWWRFVKTRPQRPPRPQTYFRLLDLPPELRVRVYDAYYQTPPKGEAHRLDVEIGPDDALYGSCKSRSDDSINLLYTCKLINSEATPAFWSSRHYDISFTDHNWNKTEDDHGLADFQRTHTSLQRFCTIEGCHFLPYVQTAQIDVDLKPDVDMTYDKPFSVFRRFVQALSQQARKKLHITDVTIVIELWTGPKAVSLFCEILAGLKCQPGVAVHMPRHAEEEPEQELIQDLAVKMRGHFFD